MIQLLLLLLLYHFTWMLCSVWKLTPSMALLDKYLVGPFL